MIRRLPLDIMPLDQPVAIGAAGLRAEHRGKLKLPDALVVAMARVHGASSLITTDRNWPPAGAIGLDGKLVVLGGT